MVQGCIEPANDAVAARGGGPRAEDEDDWEAAWAATAWRIEAVRSGFGVAGVATGAAPGEGRRYILSIVGLRAAPKGVARKSVGKSTSDTASVWGDQGIYIFKPLIKAGMDPPVRNPAQSLVNELQLKSIHSRPLRSFINDRV